jgi:long-chain fatty acid transport protein
MNALLYSAETLSVVPDTAQALATVGGRFANLHDASVVRVSPANMLEISETELLVSGAVWHGDIRLNAASGASVRMSEPWVYPASLYLVVPTTPGKLAFGIGVSTPFGMGSVYPENMDLRLRYNLPYESRLLAADITPAVAFKVSDTLSFGAGLDIIYSELTLKERAPWGMLVPGTPEGAIKMQGDGWGLGAYVGMNWKLAEHQRLAIIGRLPVKVQYDGDTSTENMPSALGALGLTKTSSFASDMTFPGSIAVGYGIDLTNRWTVGFDFQWSNNSTHDDIPLAIGNNQPLLPHDRAILNWKDSIDLGTGISYAVNDQWTLRAGYLFSENSIPALNYTPAVAANDRHVFSAGVGWRGETRGVDLAYAFVFNPERVISGDVQPAFDGSYKHQWHVFSLSFTQRF